MLLFRWHKNKFEGFDFDNILTDEKSHEYIFIWDISYKTLIGPKPFCIRFDKINGLITIYDGTRYLILLALKNMILFTTELGILKSKKWYHICFFVQFMKNQNWLLRFFACRKNIDFE